MGFFSESELALLATALDELVRDASVRGAHHYVARVLDAFDHDPPRIWAGGHGEGQPGWMELGPWEQQAWRTRIEGWREVYARVIDTLVAGANIHDVSPADRRLLYEHACEASYGDPAYGGNADGTGWQAIDFPTPLLPPTRRDDS